MNQIRRRKGQPYNPAAHDRRAQDLLRNAQVTPVEIDDPYELGGKIIVMQSTRDDCLAEMRARQQIDECQYAAGRHWQSAWENAEIGGVQGIDPTKEAVDGGALRETLTERTQRAIRDLAEARNYLGHEGNWLIVQILGTKRTFKEVAVGWLKVDYEQLEHKFVGRRFRECLDGLAIVFGYAMSTRA